jgi:hypothetical protein
MDRWKTLDEHLSILRKPGPTGGRQAVRPMWRQIAGDFGRADSPGFAATTANGSGQS